MLPDLGFGRASKKFRSQQILFEFEDLAFSAIVGYLTEAPS
jgi:hypothetical protein